MNKMIFAILIGILIFPNCYAQHLFGDKISGNEDIVSDVFLIQDGFVLDSVVSPTQTYRFEYYGNGKLKRDINFIKFVLRDSITGKYKSAAGYRDYFYNERGDADSVGTGIWNNTSPAAGPAGYRISYTFDNEENILLKSYSSNGTVYQREKNSYDSSGNLILNKIIMYEADTTYNIREYDSLNRLTLAQSIEGSITNIEQYIYQYDSSGNINCTFQSTDHDTIYHNKFNYYLEFDESEKLIYQMMRRQFNPTDSTWMDSLEIFLDYDEDGRILKMGESARFHYNDDGNLDSSSNLHPISSGYLSNKARLVDSYGNTITFTMDWDMNFYYSTFVTDVNKIKVNETSFRLSQNYPNPFNPTTTITYSLPKRSFVTLKIYDLLGREIASLVNKEKQSGTHKVDWNAQNLQSGVYFYKITAGNYSKTNKMILLK